MVPALEPQIDLMPEPKITNSTDERQQPVRRHRWWFRPAAVVLGLSMFALAELVFVIAGIGRPDEYEDPFVGFSEIRPLFVLSEDGQRYEIPKSRQAYFAADSFAARKADDDFRIFCLGGSTVQGRPYSRQTSFTTWLELLLQAAEPGRSWEVVNCGGISYASYRLVPILKECLEYEPDLFVICTGHNEFLEDRTYPEIKQAAPLWRGVHEQLSRLRTFNLMRGAARQASGDSESAPRSKLKTDVDAFLDYKDGLEAYERDDDWRAGIVEHFERNLRGMIAILERAGIPVILVLPPSNLSDSPPFKSQHRSGLSEAEAAEWNRLVTESKEFVSDDPARAVELMLQAAQIDDQHALLHFQLGKCYAAMDKRGSARTHFELARELDICPLRAVSAVENIIRDVAHDSGVPLVDVHELFEAKTADGILGEQFLLDHVHPSIEGHQLIAETLLDEMVRQGWASADPGWREQKSDVYAKQMQTLDDIYFARGQQRLSNLRAWSKGRADGPPISEHPKMRGMGGERRAEGREPDTAQ